MLCLKRKLGEAIIIGDDCRVIVGEVRGDSVVLHIDAPRSVSVHRSEVFDAIKQDFRAAVEEKLKQPDPARIFCQHEQRNGKVVAP